MPSPLPYFLSARVSYEEVESFQNADLWRFLIAKPLTKP